MHFNGMVPVDKKYLNWLRRYLPNHLGQNVSVILRIKLLVFQHSTSPHHFRVFTLGDLGLRTHSMEAHHIPLLEDNIPPALGKQSVGVVLAAGHL
jgi:hypothetical protein